ncbi:hypothetical protein [Massilia niabensis]|uniref:Phage protein n=1 Tax=Massilia niabensis TaxID=544910 RepID=A0ABW0L2U4_9BURK
MNDALDEEKFKMVQCRATAEISIDGKCVTCRFVDGRVKWARDAPSLEEWNQLAKHPVAVDLKGGKFQYVGDEIDGVIISVFTPGGSLDFNLTYLAETGG